MIENWISMNGDQEGYSISDKGNVRNNKTGKMLKNSLDCLGYYRVNINHKVNRIHNLVTKYFIRETGYKECCNHLDGNKLNNNLNNLEVTTYKENNLHAFRTGLRLPPTTVSRKVIEASMQANYKPIALINNNDEILQTFKSVKEAAEVLNIPFTHIGTVANGHRKSTYKKRFKFI